MDKKGLSQLQDFFQNRKLLVFAVGGVLLFSIGLGSFRAWKKRGVAEAVQEVCSPQAKGFELFDSNTWIKGEKELQVLEMRALKGQLERDLADFEFIKSARVILDLLQPTPFKGDLHGPKASVILTLQEDSILSPTQISAVVLHVAGAIHGLEVDRIAVSDTTGQLYKAMGEAIDRKASEVERGLRGLLTQLVGSGHFYIHMESEGAFVVIDALRMDTIEPIETQLNLMGAARIHLIPFSHHPTSIASRNYGQLALFAGILLLIFGGIYALFRRYRGRAEEEGFFQMMTRINLQHLAASMQGEDPKRIAKMLGYLEPSRAEELMMFFSADVQEAVLLALEAES